MYNVILKRFWLPVALLMAVLVIGTAGYWYISAGKASVIDCLYMTSITILTVGYSEIIDLSNNPGGRIFTIFIGFTGIGTATYMLSSATALIVEGQLKETFKKRKMEKTAKSFENHYIICGAGRVGSVILRELHSTKRDFVVIEKDPGIVKELIEKYSGIVVIEGDADNEELLSRAGINTAGGIFAATGDDNQNLVISLTAKYLNPNVRVIARCLEAVNQAKMRKAGADSVITENFIAGMRMASEMIRPTVVTFLDKMLGDKDKNLRVEEVRVSSKFSGRKISELELEKFPDTLILAVVSGEAWTYNPKEHHSVEEGCKIVMITNPEERLKIKSYLEG